MHECIFTHINICRPVLRSIFPIILSVYLLILISADLYYAVYFPSFSESWRSSGLCRTSGALFVFSSEASTFFITLLTIDRLMGVKYTFSDFRFGIKLARVLVALMWFVAFVISIATFTLSQGNLNVYAVSEICVGLPIARIHQHTVNVTVTVEVDFALYDYVSVSNYDAVYTGSRAAMYLSIAVFTGLNMACFFVVAYCYLAIFISARKTAKNAGRSPQVKEEIRMAMKIFVIVFTDFCCWVPIGIYSILVQSGLVQDNPDAYPWIALLVLPINSAINPFLYTLGSMIASKAKRNEQENIPLRAIRK